MTNRSTFSKSSSRYRPPAGVYAAQVSQVDGLNVYITVPRLTKEFEHGPIVYTGTVPTVGDFCFAHFLEGRQDDVVVIFPGGGGSAGPIEPTFFVCADSERQGLQAVADYVSPAAANQTIHDACLALPSGGGKVQLSAGRFILSPPTAGTVNEYISLYDNSTLEGVGGATILEVNPLASGWQYGIYMANYSQVKNLTIDFTNAANPGCYGIYADGNNGLIENVTFIGMDAADQEDLYYALVDWGSKAVNCRFLNLSGQVSPPST